jgi:hypothetical protein
MGCLPLPGPFVHAVAVGDARSEQRAQRRIVTVRLACNGHGLFVKIYEPQRIIFRHGYLKMLNLLTELSSDDHLDNL